MIAKLLREKALLELYVKKIQDISKNKNNFNEFLQEAIFSMKFKCKDLIGKKGS